MNPIAQVKPIEVPSAIAQRRSIKSFKTDPIHPDLLKQLIELTVAAPSSFNLQDWWIILIQDEAQKAALSAASWNQQQIIQAPVTFVFAADAAGWKKDLNQFTTKHYKVGHGLESTVNYFRTAIPQFHTTLQDKNREYAIKDAMIAATHLVLAAESLGLSTCFMNGWEEDKVKAAIGAVDDPDLAIAVLVPVGYAAEPRRNPGRLPFADKVFVDRVGNSYQG